MAIEVRVPSVQIYKEYWLAAVEDPGTLVRVHRVGDGSRYFLIYNVAAVIARLNLQARGGQGGGVWSLSLSGACETSGIKDGEVYESRFLKFLSFAGLSGNEAEWPPLG